MGSGKRGKGGKEEGRESRRVTVRPSRSEGRAEREGRGGEEPRECFTEVLLKERNIRTLLARNSEHVKSL